jgi:hypothetical protein
MNLLATPRECARRLRLTFAVVATCVGTLLAPSLTHAQDDTARRYLKAMTDYVSAQTSLAVTFDSDIEVITSELQKIQFTSTSEFMLRRPDKLRAHRKGGHTEVDFAFDGTTFAVHDRRNNAFARLSAPGLSIDLLIDRLRTDFLIEAPGADLFLANAYDILNEDVLEAKYMGLGIVDGVECQHLAFRNLDTDWQLWIETGARPIPRKYVITSKTVTGAPQYTLRIKDWRTNVPADDPNFVFNPPAGATEVDAKILMEIDEVPVGLVGQGRR